MNQLIGVAGIDPGLFGAAALVYDSLVFVWDTPTEEVKVGSKYKSRLIDSVWSDVARQVALCGPADVVIEQVNGFGRVKGKNKIAGNGGADSTGQSASASFAFGDVYGAQRMALVCHGLTVNKVAPAVWKRSFGLIGKDKDASRLLAIELWPDHAALFTPKRKVFTKVQAQGRAEAALIAEWRRRQMLAGDVAAPKRRGK